MAGGLDGGASFSAFLQFAIDRLASADILDYFRGRSLDDKLLHKLIVSLLTIHAVIDDAEEKQIIDEHVGAWLDDVKDAVLYVEDLLDEIEILVSQPMLDAESQNITSKVWNLFSASFSSFHKKLESSMQEINDNLEYFASIKDILGLKEGARLGKKVSPRLPTTSLLDEALVCGRDDDKDIIIDFLLSNCEHGNNLSVISIVGMGGMGKTTLAQLVYNDHRMKDEFDLKAWVCVSEEFDVFRVTKTILEAITFSTDDTKDINMLQVKLKEKLIGKKFLLVLDDVWNENYLNWEALQAPFVYGAHGSKILVTTRSEKVASTMRCANLHQLMQLPEEDSWSLFAKHAFRDGDPHSNAGLEEIGRKIIKKCKGLPLALKAIGSLLYTKLSYEEWNGVLTSEIWDMSDDECNIIPALRLSYQYLPSHLKRCFAYCSLLPKDYVFDKEFLVQLWMAEDLLQCQQQNKSLKEVGDQFFDDLLLKSFFQQSSGDATQFVMHDLVNDLAKYVSGDFCLRLEEEEEAKNVSKTTLHFSFKRNLTDPFKRFEAIFKARKLRTFLPLPMVGGEEYGLASMSSKMILELLSKFKWLRVLSLSGYVNIYELPDSIGNLKHLRYFDLSATGMKKLPKSTCLLYNLQTLKLRNCEYLDELPSDMHKLINLRHLDIRGTKVRKVPMELGKLKNLEVLSSFDAGNCYESNIKQLGELNLPETISNFELQNVAHPMDVFAANLKEKKHLKVLMLNWRMNHDGFQKKLSKLNPHILRVLSLSNRGITVLPPSIGELSHLRYLDLSYTALQVLPDSIGNLYNLQTLLLTNCTSLTSLPERVSDLTNLRYLDIRATGVQDMPPQMNRLTSLQKLTDFVVSRSSPGFGDLAGLSNIRTLAISNLHNVVDATDASYAKLKEKKSLNDLMLQWGSGCHDHKEVKNEVLENLVPHENIKSLTVDHYCGGGFPSWLGDELFRTLHSVKLCHCNCISLPPLGQLPGLKDLVIEGFHKLTCVGAEFYGRTGELTPFRSLESLQFREMLEWKEWKVFENIEFRYLCELSIILCPKLVEELPKKLGSLEKLEISGCYDLVASLPKMPPACEVCVHDSNEVLMRSVVEVAYSRRVTVPVDGKEFSPHSFSSVPSTGESHDESEEVIWEPDFTPLDAKSPAVDADDPNNMQAVDPQVIDTADTTDYSQRETSSSEDEQSSFEMLRVSTISQLENNLPPKLDGLRIEECTYLEALPESLLPVMPTLQELYLIDCYSFKSFHPDGFPISLRTLYVSNCPKLELFCTSESTLKFEFLEHLCLGSSCDSLKVFALNFFPKLKTLCLWDCSNLASFTISGGFRGDLTSLESLEIRDCPNLKSFPVGGLPTPNMASLLLSNCNILNNIPNSKNSLSSLQSLVLRECPALESLSLKALPSSLTSLSIAFCDKLTPHKSWGLHNLQYLSSFEIEGGCIDMESFPEEEVLPSNINSLRISTLQSLKKLDCNGFDHLKALQALEIDGCKQLQSLPEQGLPSSLIDLCIKQSPLLTQKLSSKAGEDWHKVVHIPHIEIDGEVIC